jgi:hypothetical protein
MNPATAIFGLGGAAVTLLALTMKRSQPSAAATEFSAPTPATPATPASRMLPASSIPSHAVEVVTSTPSDAIDAAPAPAQRGAKQAAQDLLAYVRPLINAGKADVLGSRSEPNDIVRIAQRDMRMKPADQDGVYGSKTAARGKEILGSEFPSRTTKRATAATRIPVRTSAPPPAAATIPLKTGAPDEPPPPPKAAEPKPLAPPAPPAAIDTPVSEHSPKEAATALYKYVTGTHVDWGSKAHPNELIRGAQKDMGKIVADGVYGPKTRERGKQLIGKTFPTRK